MKQKLVVTLSYHSPCILFKQMLEAGAIMSTRRENGQRYLFQKKLMQFQCNMTLTAAEL